MYLLIVLSVVTASYAAICPTNDNGMDDTIRQKFLDVHNELRALVASGRAKDGLGGYAPPAAAMDKLRYDCEVEKIAAAHAAKCQYEHRTLEARKYTGENLFMQTPAFDSKVEAAEEASRWWFAELEEFGVGTDLIYGDALWGKGVGHYTQMVWQTTTAIGCAVQNCGAKTIVVCNYDPSGNLDYGTLYVKGAPCSLCPAYCSNNLCVDEKPTIAPGNTTVETKHFEAKLKEMIVITWIRRRRPK
ncbi:unnamed protein product [Cylicocyclus nassatus]|uniref:SCP domain-containing protein n=1 Tax=Cylicocyclus nassatus TaxID=53992 RepID=A0AA36DKJ9_CYLNA|nr:unnamed protein product [Cylicocyclus nassatus]